MAFTRLDRPPTSAGGGGGVPDPHEHAAPDVSSGVLSDSRIPEQIRGNATAFVADWNLALESGWYSGDNVTTNGPEAYWAVVFVMRFNTEVHQVWYRHSNSSPRTFIRHRSSDGVTWGAWLRIGHFPSEITAIAQGLSVLDAQLPNRLRVGGGPLAADLNTGVALESGQWHTNDSTLNRPKAADNTGAAIAPFSIGFTLNYAGGPGLERQLLYDVNSANIYTRRNQNGTWGAWQVMPAPLAIP